MKYVGIDYGLERIGVSISDDEGRVAFPRDTMKTYTALETISNLCSEERIEHIVCGDSVDFSGNQNPVAEHARRFCAALSGRTGLPYSFHTELFSSHQAAKELHHAHTPREQKVRGEGRSEKLDAQAATIILQSYIDQQNRL